jgi:MoxR-like ATPase
VGDEILNYIIRLVRATREHPQLVQGASPRATITVTALSRATAFLRGRDFVIPEDVQFIWRDSVAHRLILPAGAAGSGTRAGQIADEVLRAVQPPRIR